MATGTETRKTSGRPPGSTEPRTARRIAGPFSFMDPLPILHPSHELEPRPHVVHRRHFHVHEAVREPNHPDHVLGEVGRHAGRLLGPRDPQHTGRRERPRQRRESALELSLLCEELNEIESAGRARTAPDLRELPERALVPLGAWRIAMRISGFIPSLATKGLPEYPVTCYRPLYITRQILPAASSVMYREPSGPTATPTGRCCGPAPSWCQKPSANVSYVPTGLPSLKGTNTTR